MKVLFWFRKSEAKSSTLNSDPTGSIQCRITINNEDVEIGSTQVTCQKSYWDAPSQSLTGNVLMYKRANQKLNEMSCDLLRLYDILVTKYDYVTPQLVKDYYLSKRKFIYSLSEIREKFSEFRKNLVAGKVITKSTFDVNENYTRHIMDYAAKMKLTSPLHLPEAFFSDLYEFLIAGRCDIRMARKVTCFAKQILVWAKNKSLCPDLRCMHQNMPGHADSEDFIDTTHLSVDQIERLRKFDFQKLVREGKITTQAATTLQHERDAFVFNCFTGMHHCDYHDKGFQIDQMYGSLFLKGRRKKTKKPFAVKLLEPAVEILARYGGDLRQLPIKSNQKRNDTLKLIANYVEIPLRLSTKIARKTFCDLALNEIMMSSDDVAACLGLTSTKYLKNYGRIRERRLMKAMKSWEELKIAS